MASFITLVSDEQPPQFCEPRVRRARTRPQLQPSRLKTDPEVDSVQEPIYDEDTDSDDDEEQEREWNEYLSAQSAEPHQIQTEPRRSARTTQFRTLTAIERIAAAERLHLDLRAAFKARTQASSAPSQRFDALLFGHTTQSFIDADEYDEFNNELQARVYDQEVFRHARCSLRAIRLRPTEHVATRVGLSAVLTRAYECVRQTLGGSERTQAQDSQASQTPAFVHSGPVGNVPPPPYRRIDALATDVLQLTEIYARGRSELAEWVHRYQQKEMAQEKSQLLPGYSEVDPLAVLPRY